MRAFSFQIDPVGNLGKPASPRHKAGGILAPKLNRRARKASYPDKPTSPRPDDAPRPPAKAKQHVLPVAAHPTPNAVSRFTREICATRQIRYGRFAISTSRVIDGRWIANFGCTEGSSTCVEDGRQAIWATEPHLAESLAIADALTRIDALAIRSEVTWNNPRPIPAQAQNVVGTLITARTSGASDVTPNSKFAFKETFGATR